jgi:predicted molibdopterin-dependent oxidoreductase YjgC
VVLPLSSWAEYDGQFVNLEGTVKDFKAAVKPFGRSLPGYELINKIAAEMKTPVFESPEQLHNEVKSVLDFNLPGDLIGEFVDVKYGEEKINPDFPTPLIVADQLHHFGYLTEKTRSLSAFCGEAFLEISPAMAERLTVENGSIVRIESETGKINLPVKISENIDNDVVVAYRNFSASPVNVLQMRKRRVDRVKITRVEGA